MTLQEPDFWTRQLPLSVFLGVFIAGVICAKLEVLHKYVPLKLRVTAILGGLAGLAALILVLKFTKPDQASLFIYSEKPAAVEIFMDGRPIKLRNLSGATLVPLNDKGPNLLEIRESGELVLTQAVKKERYAVNCSTTRTTACQRITYTTDRIGALFPSQSGKSLSFPGIRTWHPEDRAS